MCRPCSRPQSSCMKTPGVERNGKFGSIICRGLPIDDDRREFHCLHTLVRLMRTRMGNLAKILKRISSGRFCQIFASMSRRFTSISRKASWTLLKINNSHTRSGFLNPIKIIGSLSAHVGLRFKILQEKKASAHYRKSFILAEMLWPFVSPTTL